MKKPLALLLCSAMVVGALVGCGSKKEETKAAETTAETTAETAGETGESNEAAEGEKNGLSPQIQFLNLSSTPMKTATL